MENKKYMLVPQHLFRTGALEHWLCDMASKGWYLKNMYGDIFASFTKGTPGKVRYRLEPLVSRDQNILEKNRADYAEMGWTWICDIDCVLSAYLSVSPSNAELFTDTDSYRILLKRLQKRDMPRFFFGLFFGILCLFLLFFGFGAFETKYLFYALFESMTLWTSSFLVVFIIGLPSFLVPSELLLYARTKKRIKVIEETNTLTHDDNYLQGSARHKLRMLFHFVFIIAFIILYFMVQYNTISRSAGSYDTLDADALTADTLPGIRLEQLEGSGFSYTLSDSQSPQTLQNTLTTDTLLFFNKRFNIHEIGDDSAQRSVSLQTLYYRMHTASVAKWFVTAASGYEYDCSKKYFSVSEPLQTIHVPGVDNAYYFENSNLQQQLLFLQKGNLVYILKYIGSRQLSDFYPMMAASMKN